MWLSMIAGAEAKAALKTPQNPMRFPARGAFWCRSYSIFTYSLELRAGSIWFLRVLGRSSLSWAVPAGMKSLCSKKSAVRVVSSTYASSTSLSQCISRRSQDSYHEVAGTRSGEVIRDLQMTQMTFPGSAQSKVPAV